jgi:predicted nucleic acid-binding protein
MISLHQLAAGPRQQARLWSNFRDDWEAFAVVPVDDRCLARAVEVGSEFGVRIVDAVHLAAADRLPRPVRYLTFDRHQIPAAAALDLEVVSPVEA